MKKKRFPTAGLSCVLVFLVTACQKPTERRTDFKVHGIDVSHHQDYIDWEMVAQQTIHFAYIKATEGITFKDTQFARNWVESRKHSIRRGAYHYFLPEYNARKQARHFLSQVKNDSTDLPPALDVQVVHGVKPDSLVRGIRIWLEEVELQAGIRPIVYTSMSFYNEHLAGKLSDYDIWIARYNTALPSLRRAQPWVIWQYGNRGEVAGIDGSVDLNVFSGSVEEFNQFGKRNKMYLYSFR